MTQPYIGRFAPSPTGPLHAGSLVAALASWLDARAHGGKWLVRIEDTDTPRTLHGADAYILTQLAAHGMLPDEPPQRQSGRTALYASVAERLRAADQIYACDCSRRALRSRSGGGSGGGSGSGSGSGSEKPSAVHPALPAPAVCRQDGCGDSVLRLRTLLADGSDSQVAWVDRRLGAAQQNVTRDVGDFVLRRSDGCWAYQLAVVVDDAAQGVTDIVRGADLADNAPRQVHLQRVLGLPMPRYLHTPLVMAADGQKLSKQTGATPLAMEQPLASLQAAAAVLGLSVDGHWTTTRSWLAAAVIAWQAQWRCAAS